MPRPKMAQLWTQLMMMVILVLLNTVCVFAVYPKLGVLGGAARSKVMESEEPPLPPEFEIHYYTQTLDHFNYKPESYATFQQRYVLNFKHWGGANTSSPIFFYVGEESDIIYDVLYVGFIKNLAAHFKGLLLYIEHRYYGESFPFGSEDIALQNASTLGYLSSEQALADYAQVIVDVKKKLSAENSPVIALGGSYGGMLASWSRLKYPHIVHGALASSAPVLLSIDDTPQDAYFTVISKTFRDTSESCYNTIRQSWSEIDRAAAEPNGLATLGKALNSCSPLNSSQEVKDNLANLYWGLAQYDNPPLYYVKQICDAIDGAPAGTDILGRIYAGLNSPIFGNISTCYYFSDDEGPYKDSSWSWQTCTEFVIAAGTLNNDTMFPAFPFDLNQYTKDCKRVLGAVPRLHWVPVQFGGQEIKSLLGSFGSNIIFSNGLRDPYSSAGILEDISDSIVALHTEEGAHCLDILTPSPGDDKLPWLVSLREKEFKLIAYWLAKYYANLHKTGG